MRGSVKYDSSAEFAKALERELERLSSGNDLLLRELSNDIALERLVSRFDPESVVVKGGFSVRTFVNPSPYTQDIDLLIALSPY